MIYFGTHHVKPATFLIPNSFRGKIIIIYGEPYGIKIPEKDGRYILKVPANGVMIVKNPLETGIIDEQYYFEDASYKKNKKIEILEQQDFNEDYTLEKTNKNLQEKSCCFFRWYRRL
ncbi:hypothetical protein NAF17_12230 [Mucilaginibacter sp. RB4R14]|uniref:DUF6843 domain-containing protein n=1 Tax=Mucilaginibacter aurantiaciroseus TaxID=2949308 RepID=UPI00209090A4|nr:hypothetical protein [Mucilaginibacter aurantiaciroseus]MCO5936308.1 hypothetical protein [Mucilaginibacter aurantiaciroseus]